MTAPTQAQREAAINAMLIEWVKESPNRLFGPPAAYWAEIGMSAALTAAAEAREPLQDEPCPELARKMREAHKRKVARTAAAEVGEHSAIDAFNKGYKQAWDNATTTTIERCAQVVDGLAKKANRSEITKLEEAAAALRAMKDFSVIRMCVWSSCL